ncbi:CheR family methyltransferase [Alkalimarinus alittae]|uniref:Chemotaxis protein methyltransferase n=1 Tax=Alkalimarinus alittae TaxID=2961619 RepID=A0ABY6N7T9_9ALTE|nr:protein-glutamate O-methyltransferase [Alkalimarinus alittae]UZE98047.1 protein-glutamate O-methyltransferase [Alkalimarinus alittae]
MTSEDFETISLLAHNYTGIVLGAHKRDMIYGRLARRIRSLGLSNFNQYCALISSPSSPEISFFINAITTNLTSFFREPHHFDFLKETVLPEIKRKNDRYKRIRIWSAGCSTGEEPYSLSITVNETLNMAQWDCKILATDLDSNVVNHGREGVYDITRIDALTEQSKKQWFYKDSRNPEVVKVKPALQQCTRFKRLNLLESWPMKGPFDIIFCRNVVIYFNKETQRQLFDRFANILGDGGYLFIGHSESLHKVSERFESLGKNIYRKKF